MPFNLTRVSGTWALPDRYAQTYYRDDGDEDPFFGGAVGQAMMMLRSDVTTSGRSWTSSKITTALSAVPFSDDRGCKHNPDPQALETLVGVPGIRWADGYLYTPAMWDANADCNVVASDDVTETRVQNFDCGHCAIKAAHAWASVRGTVDANYDRYTLAHVYTVQTCPRALYLPGPEIIGGTRVANRTIKSSEEAARLPNSCSRCGMIGHNMRTCSSTDGKVYSKVGIEIEGLWDDLHATRARATRDGLGGCSDGSIVRNSGSTAMPYEFQTAPGSLRESIEQLVNFYPDETNPTCGMHVHVSFPSPADVSLLCTPAFFAYFRARWEAWGDRMNVWGRGEGTRETARGLFWARLYGENSYCRVNTGTPRQVTDMDRYHQLNFSAYHEHKTVECRLLPMFKNQALAVSAVQELLDIYERFLNSHETFGLAFEANVESEIPQSLTVNRQIEAPTINDGVSVVSQEMLVDEYHPAPPGAMRFWHGQTSGLTLEYAVARARQS